VQFHNSHYNPQKYKSLFIFFSSLFFSRRMKSSIKTQKTKIFCAVLTKTTDFSQKIAACAVNLPHKQNDIIVVCVRQFSQLD